MAAAWADKFCSSPWEQKDPVGVVGITAPAQWPMLGLCSLLGPAIAAGNTVVILPSDKFPLVAADLCQVAIKYSFFICIILKILLLFEDSFIQNFSIQILLYNSQISIPKVVL